MPRTLENELIRARAFLTLLDSVSSVGIPSAELFSLIDSISEAGLTAQFLGKYLLVGYTNFPEVTAPFGDQLPAVVVYNIQDGQLSETARLTIPENAVIDGVAFSPNPRRPFIAVSQTNTDNTATITIYLLNPDGTISAPLQVLDPVTLGAVINLQTTFQGILGFSSDGHFLAYQYTSAVDVDLNPTAVTLVIFEVSDAGQLTIAAQIILPIIQAIVTTVQPEISFAKNPCEEPAYDLILGLNGAIGLNPLGPVSVSALQSYRFNPCRGTIRLTGSQPMNQAIIGYDLHPCLDRVAVITREAAIAGLSVLQVPPAPFDSPAPRPGDELRLYSFNNEAKRNALEFLKGHDLGARGTQVRWSESGQFLALTERAAGTVPSGFIIPDSVPPILAQAQSPGILATLSYSRESDVLLFEDLKVTSPLPLALAWGDDRLLTVVGMPTTVQKDTQLYKVSKQ